MSKLFSKVIIENIEKYNYNEKEAGLFVDIYNSTVKKMATTLVPRDKVMLYFMNIVAVTNMITWLLTSY